MSLSFVHYFISKQSICSFPLPPCITDCAFSYFLCTMRVSSLLPHTCTRALATLPISWYNSLFPSPPPHISSTRFQILKDDFYHDANLFTNLYTFPPPFANFTKPKKKYESSEKEFSVLSEQMWRHFFATQPHRTTIW